MANEASVRCTLSIKKKDDDTGLQLINYQNLPGSFRATVTGTKGPSPGALTIPVGGKFVSLEELTVPGLVRIKNCDATNYVEYGLYDVDADIFRPLGELLAGEEYVLRFSRNLFEEYEGTGTGTSTAGANRFMMKANTADVIVVVDAFEA
jgi:hypothetical protein